MIGKIILNYLILQKLGEGGMGTVYLADDTMLEKKVAIKFLKPEFSQDGTLVEMFKNEAKIQATLKHQNIIETFSLHNVNGQYLFVMEYADGIPLNRIIQTIGPISEQRVAKIFGQLLKAFDYAHNIGIIHRDIKPSNLIINYNDEIKITDFGIAKLLNSRSNTRTGVVKGSLYYMSPEQILGNKEIDNRSDLYSLGVNLFEMLTGKVPFDTNDTDFQIMNAIVHQPLPNPRNYYPYISDGMLYILKILTEKNPENRYNNCQECYSDIKKLLFADNNSNVYLNQVINNSNTHSNTAILKSEKSNVSKNNCIINKKEIQNKYKYFIILLTIGVAVSIVGFIDQFFVSVNKEYYDIIFPIANIYLERYYISSFYHILTGLLEIYIILKLILKKQFPKKTFYLLLGISIFLLMKGIVSNDFFTGKQIILQSVVLIIWLLYDLNKKNDKKS